MSAGSPPDVEQKFASLVEPTVAKGLLSKGELPVHVHRKRPCHAHPRQDSRLAALEKDGSRGHCMITMAHPIEVDLPHQLGKDEARRRIANNVHKLEEHIPGGAAVQSGWAGDQLNLIINALGQAVEAAIDVEDSKVHLKVLLPGMLILSRSRLASVLVARSFAAHFAGSQ